MRPPPPPMADRTVLVNPTGRNMRPPPPPPRPTAHPPLPSRISPHISSSANASTTFTNAVLALADRLGDNVNGILASPRQPSPRQPSPHANRHISSGCNRRDIIGVNMQSRCHWGDSLSNINRYGNRLQTNASAAPVEVLAVPSAPVDVRAVSFAPAAVLAVPSAPVDVPSADSAVRVPNAHRGGSTSRTSATAPPGIGDRHIPVMHNDRHPDAMPIRKAPVREYYDRGHTHTQTQMHYTRQMTHGGRAQSPTGHTHGGRVQSPTGHTHGRHGAFPNNNPPFNIPINVFVPPVKAPTTLSELCSGVKTDTILVAQHVYRSIPPCPCCVKDRRTRCDHANLQQMTDDVHKGAKCTLAADSTKCIHCLFVCTVVVVCNPNAECTLDTCCRGQLHQNTTPLFCHRCKVALRTMLFGQLTDTADSLANMILLDSRR